MDFAFECKTGALQAIQPLGDFEWILTHLVLEDPVYADFYKYSTRMKVLDNSVNELGEPCTKDKMIEAARIVEPDWVVPPDWLGDGVKTINELNKWVDFPYGKILPCVQGSTVMGVSEMAESYASLGFTSIAIPYDLGHSRVDKPYDMGMTRVSIIKLIYGMFDWIHLLGFTHPDELRMYNRMRINNISMDTGYPIMCGAKGVLLHSDNLPMKDKPTLAQMQGKGTVQDMYYNIAYLRKLVKDI